MYQSKYTPLALSPYFNRVEEGLDFILFKYQTDFEIRDNLAVNQRLHKMYRKLGEIFAE